MTSAKQHDRERAGAGIDESTGDGKGDERAGGKRHQRKTYLTRTEVESLRQRGNA